MQTFRVGARKSGGGFRWSNNKEEIARREERRARMNPFLVMRGEVVLSECPTMESAQKMALKLPGSRVEVRK